MFVPIHQVKTMSTTGPIPSLSNGDIEKKDLTYIVIPFIVSHDHSMLVLCISEQYHQLEIYFVDNEMQLLKSIISTAWYHGLAHCFRHRT